MWNLEQIYRDKLFLRSSYALPRPENNRSPLTMRFSVTTVAHTRRFTRCKHCERSEQAHPRGHFHQRRLCRHLVRTGSLARLGKGLHNGGAIRLRRARHRAIRVGDGAADGSRPGLFACPSWRHGVTGHRRLLLVQRWNEAPHLHQCAEGLAREDTW